MHKIYLFLYLMIDMFLFQVVAQPVEIWMGDKPFGQGVLIDNHCVLTAGHCIVGLMIYEKLHQDEPWIQRPENNQRYFIEKMKIAPEFHTPSPVLNSGEFHQDWGLIFLTEHCPEFTPISFKYTIGPSVDLLSPESYRKGESGQGIWDDEQGTLIGVHSRTTAQGWSFNTLVTREIVEALKGAH